MVISSDMSMVPYDRELGHVNLGGDCHYAYFQRDVQICSLAYLDIMENYLTKIKVVTDQRYVFLTLQNFQLRHKDVEKMELFINKIKYLYKEGLSVIESGSQTIQDDCNYHIHIFAMIKNNKQHKQKIKLEFIKLFNQDITIKDYYKLQTWNSSESMPPYKQWFDEKMDYMRKGTTLKNTFPSVICDF